MSNEYIHEKRIWQDCQTIERYEKLSFFEKEEIIRWLKKNLAFIPVAHKTKNRGFASLIAGEHESPSALLLIRHALAELHF